VATFNQLQAPRYIILLKKDLLAVTLIVILEHPLSVGR